MPRCVVLAPVLGKLRKKSGSTGSALSFTSQNPNPKPAMPYRMARKALYTEIQNVEGG